MVMNQLKQFLQNRGNFLCRDIKIHLEEKITIEFLAGENFTFLPISMP